MAIKRIIRTKHNKYKEVEHTPLQTIREKCRECSDYQDHEIKTCHMTDCVNWVYRMGKSGNTKNITDEQRQKLSDNMKKIGLSNKKESNNTTNK